MRLSKWTSAAGSAVSKDTAEKANGPEVEPSATASAVDLSLRRVLGWVSACLECYVVSGLGPISSCYTDLQSDIAVWRRVYSD